MHRSQMLGGKTGVAAQGTNILDAKRATGDCGQGQRGAQDLAPALTVSAIDDHTVCLSDRQPPL